MFSYFQAKDPSCTLEGEIISLVLGEKRTKNPVKNKLKATDPARLPNQTTKPQSKPFPAPFPKKGQQYRNKKVKRKKFI